MTIDDKKQLEQVRALVAQAKTACQLGSNIARLFNKEWP